MAQRLPRSLIGFTALVYFLLHLPILVLVIFSFNSSRYVVWTGLSLNWYKRLLERPDILAALKASLIVGICSTLVSTILGTLIALALARHKFKGRTLFEGLLYVPIVTPEIVVGISLLILFAAFKIPLGLSTITIAHIAFNISFVVVVVLARIQGMDQNLEEAAMNLGADRLRTILKVTLPVIRPGVVAAALFSFVVSFGNLELSLFLVSPGETTLPIAILQYLEWKIDPSIAAVSLIQIAIIAAAMVITNRFVRLSQVV